MKLNHQVHPFHLVTYSPWPVLASIASLISTIGIVLSVNGYKSRVLVIGIILVILTMVLWFIDILTEACLMGQTTTKVSRSMTIGFILFMISEVFIFGTLFWAYFHSSISPSIELGSTWPPVGIRTVDNRELPLTNTIILLTTGATMTAAHNKFITRKYEEVVRYITITIILLIVFMVFQGIEYKYAGFTITDSVFGSVFYITTSMHFLHILIATIYLIVIMYRIINSKMTNNGIGSFEYCVLALHCYDILWIIIYLGFYVWPGK